MGHALVGKLCGLEHQCHPSRQQAYRDGRPWSIQVQETSLDDPNGFPAIGIADLITAGASRVSILKVDIEGIPRFRSLAHQTLLGSGTSMPSQSSCMTILIGVSQPTSSPVLSPASSTHGGLASFSLVSGPAHSDRSHRVRAPNHDTGPQRPPGSPTSVCGHVR